MAKETRLYIRIDEDLKGKLQELADMENRSLSNYVLTILSKQVQNEEEVKMKNLEGLYGEWRKISEEMLEDGMGGSVDCGEQAVREDFSNYAGLEEEISFEEMLELEQS